MDRGISRECLQVLIDNSPKLKSFTLCDSALFKVDDCEILKQVPDLHTLNFQRFRFRDITPMISLIECHKTSLKKLGFTATAFPKGCSTDIFKSLALDSFKITTQDRTQEVQDIFLGLLSSPLKSLHARVAHQLDNVPQLEHLTSLSLLDQSASNIFALVEKSANLQSVCLKNCYPDAKIISMLQSVHTLAIIHPRNDCKGIWKGFNFEKLKSLTAYGHFCEDFESFDQNISVLESLTLQDIMHSVPSCVMSKLVQSPMLTRLDFSYSHSFSSTEIPFTQLPSSLKVLQLSSVNITDSDLMALATNLSNLQMLRLVQVPVTAKIFQSEQGLKLFKQLQVFSLRLFKKKKKKIRCLKICSKDSCFVEPSCLSFRSLHLLDDAEFTRRRFIVASALSCNASRLLFLRFSFEIER